MGNNLYIFTSSFPFGTKDTPYLSFELECLEHYFSKIVLVPFSADLDKPLATDKYFVDTSLSTYPRNRPPFSLLINKDIIKETFSALLQFRIDRLKKLWWALIVGNTVADWINQNINDEENNLVYSYWFSSITIGLALARTKGLSNAIVTRAHRGDLYHKYTHTNYFPLRNFVLSKIDRVFPISQDGKEYLSTHYPNYKSKFEVSRLGISGSESLSLPSVISSNISIVSCSYIRPVKRLSLLCDILLKFAHSNPSFEITWNHFGGGSKGDLDMLKDLIYEFPDNLNANLWGNVSNEKVYQFYRKNFVDFFFSVSESEGIPVSMMEAQSFGIPIIATSVGGVSELVNEENGKLLRKDITPEEGAKIISEFIKNKDHIRKRESAKNNWSEKFNATKNYSQFGESLINILEKEK